MAGVDKEGGIRNMTVREQVLAHLADGQTVSGEELAAELGVSRNAVWKAMNGLRQEGYEIDAVTNRGYRLVSAPRKLSETEIRRHLSGGCAGWPLEIHERLDSTNNRAKALAAAGAPQGTAVIADSQSGGRGRLGRSFFSPEHSGIYLSVIFRPECGPEQAGLLTSLAAVATARAIEHTADTDVRIKWVNDLYIGEKKVCGILSEAGLGMEAGRLEYAVVGIGINVCRMTFPEELKTIATSIGNETGRDPDRNRLIAEILKELEGLYGELETGAFLEESRRRSNVIGRTVTVIEGERRYPAKAVDIDDGGRLIIETENGRQALNYGEVSLKLTEGEI
jgi:birA, biotin-[acetyl-CoA-carboxylase] ligase region